MFIYVDRKNKQREREKERSKINGAKICAADREGARENER